MHHRLDGKNGYQQLPIHGDSISPILTSSSNIAAPRYVSFVSYSSRTPPSPLIYGTWMNVIYHAPQQPTTNPAPPRERNTIDIPGNDQSMINKYLLITGTHSLSNSPNPQQKTAFNPSNLQYSRIANPIPCSIDGAEFPYIALKRHQRISLFL